MKNERINRRSQVPYRRGLVGIFFVISGMLWLYFRDVTSALEYVIPGFFVLFGIIIVLYSLYEVIQYKRKGEVKIRTDERAELNALKASRKGFIFLAGSIAILIMLSGFDIIDEKIFSSLAGVAFAIGFIAYILSYYMYEREDEKTNKIILTIIEIALGVMIAAAVIMGPVIIQDYILPPIVEQGRSDHHISSDDSIYTVGIEPLYDDIFNYPQISGLILEARLHGFASGHRTEEKIISEERTIYSEIQDVVDIYRINSTFWRILDYDGYIIWIQAKGKVSDIPARSLRTRVKINNGVITDWTPSGAINVEKNKEYERSLIKLQSGGNVLDIRQKYFMEQGKFTVYNLKEDEFEAGWEGKTTGEPYILLGLEVKVPKGEKPDILVNSRLFA